MTGLTANAVIAVFFGALLAVVLFVPVVAVRYRRAGRLQPLDVVLLLACTVYGLALWSYTLLPAPEPGSYACAGTQLEPLGTVRGIDRTLSPRSLLQDPAFLQVALNIALFLPFGYLVRAVVRRGVVVATLAGALVSLSIELTQLTGVWGVYECAYRVFDVDDLILNTAGALIGSVVAIPFVAVLHRGARRPPPARITIGRRWTGLLCDLLVVMLLSGAVGIAFNAWALSVQQIPFERWDTGLRDALQLGVPLAVQALCVLVRGQSVGELVVQLQTAPPRPIGAPALVLRRAVKLVLGAGAGTVLIVADVPGLLLPVFALVTLAAPLADAERRGLATAAAGLRLRSRRAPEIEQRAARTGER